MEERFRDRQWVADDEYNNGAGDGVGPVRVKVKKARGTVTRNSLFLSLVVGGLAGGLLSWDDVRVVVGRLL